MKAIVIVPDAPTGRKLIEAGLPISRENVVVAADTQSYEFEKDTRYLMYGKESFQFVQSQGIRFGLRHDENYSNAAKCKYLITYDGLVFKQAYIDYEESERWLTYTEYNTILTAMQENPLLRVGTKLEKGVSRKTGRPWYRASYRTLTITPEVRAYLSEEDFVEPAPKLRYYKCIREPEDIINSFKYFINLPVGSYIGLDYETSKYKPFDSPEYHPMGVALADCSGVAAYFDMEWMERPENLASWGLFYKLFREFLDKHGDNCITYNCGFEMRCTYLLYHKMYMFQDAAALNKIQGSTDRRYTLKLTAQKELHVPSWDDLFEEFQELFDDLFESTDKDNYENSDQWNTIVEKSKELCVDTYEMKDLLSRYWGDKFSCIPFETLGEYCCKDAFYTALIRRKSDELGYSKVCWDTFDDNLRMEAFLDMNGQYIDYKINREYALQGWWMVLYSKANLCKARLTWDLEDMDVPDTSLLNPEFLSIVTKGYNPLESKSFVQNFVTDNVIDLERMKEECGEIISTIVQQNLPSLGDYKKLARSRKCWEAITAHIREYWKITNLDLYTDPNLHSWYKTKRNLDIMNEVIRNIDRSNPEDSGVTALGKHYTLTEFIAFCDEIFNTNSPDIKIPLETHQLKDNAKCMWAIHNCNKSELLEMSELPEIGDIQNSKLPYFVMYRDLFKAYDAILSKLMGEMVLSVSNTDEVREIISHAQKTKEPFFASIFLPEYLKKITWTIDDALKFETFPDPVTPDKVVSAAYHGLDESKEMLYRTMLGSYYAQEFLNSDAKSKFVQMFDKIDPSECSVRGYAKFGACMLISKKYKKSLSAYLDGKDPGAQSTMLTQGRIIPGNYDENYMIPDRFEHGDVNDVEANPVQHIYSKFKVMECASLRWAAGLHTLPGHGYACQVKRCVTTPKGMLMSYFDISGAEVRSVAFLSKDEFMLKAYGTPRDDYDASWANTDQSWRVRGQDPYINCAKIIFPGRTDKEYKSMRKKFKTILLGSLYGMGVPTLAGQINETVEYAQEAHDKMFELMHSLDEFIKHKSSYPEAHGRYIESVLGNKIRIPKDEPQERVSKLGINL